MLSLFNNWIGSGAARCFVLGRTSAAGVSPAAVPPSLLHWALLFSQVLAVTLPARLPRATANGVAL